MNFQGKSLFQAPEQLLTVKQSEMRCRILISFWLSFFVLVFWCPGKTGHQNNVTKWVTPKICMLCFVIINSILFNFSCVGSCFRMLAVILASARSWFTVPLILQRRLNGPTRRSGRVAAMPKTWSSSCSPTTPWSVWARQGRRKWRSTPSLTA